MKKILLLFLIIGILLLCISCSTPQNNTDADTSGKEDLQETVPEEKHSEFYMEEYSVDDVLKYFNEVVLKTEYSTGTGDSTLVQRWDIAIRYRLVGNFTDEDTETLENLFAELNKVEGFPGVSEATENEEPNLYIYFENREDFNDRFMEFLNNEYADGATRYWYYTDTNDIYEGIIGYCTDMDPEIRKSVLLEEVVNCLGLGDSVSREDSIVYQYSSDATALTEMDWLIIRLLYNQRIRCGMDVAECERIIRELYY